MEKITVINNLTGTVLEVEEMVPEEGAANAAVQPPQSLEERLAELEQVMADLASLQLEV